MYNSFELEIIIFSLSSYEKNNLFVLGFKLDKSMRAENAIDSKHTGHNYNIYS